MLVNAKFKPYPSGVNEISIPLDEEKYLKFNINEKSELDEEGNVIDPEQLIESMVITYYDGIDDSELIGMSKSEASTLVTIIRDLLRQMK